MAGALAHGARAIKSTKKSLPESGNFLFWKGIILRIIQEVRHEIHARRFGMSEARRTDITPGTETSGRAGKEISGNHGR
jgi:hypothetical protein